jgi:hypothetical protein
VSARRTAVAACALILSACSPDAPKGVDKAVLDQAVNQAIGDPNTCVIIAKRSGGEVYRFGAYVACERGMPACAAGAPNRSAADLAKATAKGGEALNASCPSTADRSRGVAWAAGPVPGRDDLVYAASMEGPATPPGLVIADKLETAFSRAGLGPKP